MKSAVVFFFCLLAVSSCQAFKEPISSAYTSTLNAAQVTSGSQSGATGTATLYYNAKNEVLSWRVTHNVQNPLTADIHGPAEPGVESSNSVVLFDSATSPIVGSAKISDKNALNLMNGLLYIQIHTANNPLGEIRGQIDLAGIEAWASGKVTMTPDQVVPPSGLKGKGTFTFWYSNLTRVMSWDLSHSVVNATILHAHAPGTATQNSGVILATPLSEDEQKTAAGNWTLTEQDEEYLRAGLVYVNIHGGDDSREVVRGQIENVTNFKLAVDDDSDDGGLGGGAIFGIIIGVLLALILVALLAYFIYSKKGTSFTSTAQSNQYRNNGGQMATPFLDDHQTV